MPRSSTCPCASLLAAILAALPACSTADGGAAPGPVVCDEIATQLADDDSAELGFSVADVLARFGGPRTATLEHYEAGTTELTLELHVVTAERVVTSYPDGVEPDDAPDLECGATSMRLAVSLDFVTADGLFDEALTTTWTLDSVPDHESVIVDLPTADLGGSHAATADYLSFNITLGEADPSGVVVGVIGGDFPEESNVARFNYPTWPQSQ